MEVNNEDEKEPSHKLPLHSTGVSKVRFNHYFSDSDGIPVCDKKHQVKLVLTLPTYTIFLSFGKN